MNRESFWRIIEHSGAEAGDVYDLPPLVTNALTALTLDEIISFKQHQCDLLDESYRWDLWAVAYIINGGCSDDGFDYFRSWLMANGRTRWDAAMKAPESVGEWAEGDEGLEEFDYVAIEAYESKTGKDFPYDKITVAPNAEPAGESWDEEQLGELYPTLWEKFS